jgi:hypothetical protein
MSSIGSKSMWSSETKKILVKKHFKFFQNTEVINFKNQNYRPTVDIVHAASKTLWAHITYLDEPNALCTVYTHWNQLITHLLTPFPLTLQ